MKSWPMAVTTALLSSLWMGAATAQTPDLEPGVQTSAPAPAPAAAPSPAPSAAQKPPSRPVLNPANATPAAPTAAVKSKDHIELDTTQISGNRELPKVMYVVPWRKADLGEFAGRPPNSLLDEALTPVDRDVFRRQNRYYSALEAGTAASKSQPDASAGKAAGSEPKDEK
jgi:hypothetical protein